MTAIEPGARIEAARDHLSLSQGELAALLGVTQQTISHWENGVSRPTRARRAKLVEVLGVDFDDRELSGWELRQNASKGDIAEVIDRLDRLQESIERLAEQWGIA